MAIKFSVKGTGYKIKVFNEESILFQKTKNLSIDKLHALLYNNDAVLSLKIGSAKGLFAQSIYEITADKQFIVYEPSRFSRIEIRNNVGEHYKIFFNKIIKENLLFSFYECVYSFNVFNENGLVMFEKDIGEFGQCKIADENFNLKDLSFEFTPISVLHSQFITKIFYQTRQLSFNKINTVYNGSSLIKRI